MSTTIRIGQRVTCIDASSFVILYGETVPQLNHVYTVRSVGGNPDGGTGQCLRLKEIINAPEPYASGIAECSFKASRFAIKHGK